MFSVFSNENESEMKMKRHELYTSYYWDCVIFGHLLSLSIVYIYCIHHRAGVISPNSIRRNKRAASGMKKWLAKTATNTWCILFVWTQIFHSSTSNKLNKISKSWEYPIRFCCSSTIQLLPSSYDGGSNRFRFNAIWFEWGFWLLYFHQMLLESEMLRYKD